MKVDELKSLAQDAISVRKVFGEPIERDGVTVIPVARVAGGGGAGSGQDERGQEGEGGGFGLGGTPAGVFVIKDGKVRWQPAVDPNRLIAVLGMVAVALTAARLKARRRR